MVGEVFAFALVMSIFEFALLSMMPPRTRLRLLGSDISKTICHISFLCANLWVHWGTIVGTMSSTLSFITSMATIWLASKLFGYIESDRYYHVGILKYSIGELK
jgi:hypothetical protein